MQREAERKQREREQLKLQEEQERLQRKKVYISPLHHVIKHSIIVNSSSNRAIWLKVFYLCCYN